MWKVSIGLTSDITDAGKKTQGENCPADNAATWRSLLRRVTDPYGLVPLPESGLQYVVDVHFFN